MGGSRVSNLLRLKPTNRHLLIVPHEKENKTETGVLLPDDFELEKSRYLEATVIDVSEDCSPCFKRFKFGSISEDKRIIIDRSMMQEVTASDRRHFLILENYVLGFYTGASTI